MPPPELTECDREKVDWNAVNILEWNDLLPDQSRFKDFEGLLESMVGDYDVTYQKAHGTLRLSREEQQPYQVFDGSICAKFFRMPVHLELTQGDNTWAKTVNLSVAYEHVGYVTDREVPKPKLLIPASGFGMIDDVKSFPSFGTGDRFPEKVENGTFIESRMKISLFPGERATIEVGASELIVGRAGGQMYAYRPWFEIHGDLVDRP